MDSISGVGVLDKAVGVLRALRSHGPLGLADLQAATGLPRATAHRLVVALVDHGLVRRDGSGRFCLGFELIAMGRAASDSFPLAEIAGPALAELLETTAESVQLFVREGDERRCVVSLQSPHGLRWIVPVGARLPLGVGSAGRVLAVRHVTPHAAQSWIESIEEREPGVASVSAAVVGPSGSVIAAVSVSGPVERLSRQPGERFGQAVVRAAVAVSRAAASADPGADS